MKHPIKRIQLALVLALPVTAVLAQPLAHPPVHHARQLAAIMSPPWQGDLRMGTAPEISQGRLSSFPVAGSAVSLSYLYHDPDCDDLPAKAEYCADEDEEMAEIDWQINHIVDASLRDKRQVTLTTPAGWD